MKPFEDPMAFENNKKLITRLESRLNIQLDGAHDRLEDCRRHEKPFNFEEEPVNELVTIAGGFATRWCTPLSTLFTKFSPYEKFIKARENHNTLCPEFANWYALKQSADDAGRGGRASQLLDELEHALRNRDPDPIIISDYREALTEFDQIKLEKQLAFTVVFQRAMIFAFLQFLKVTDSMIDFMNGEDDFDLDEFGEEDEEQIENEVLSAEEELRAQQLVESLNKALEMAPELLTVGCEFPWHDDTDKYDRFWLCSFANPTGTIDFSQSAAKRASDWLLLVALLWLYRQNENDFDAVFDRSEDEAAAGLDLKLHQCFNRLSINSGSIAEKILSTRGLDFDDDEKKWREIEGRARWIWSLIAS